MEEENKVDIAKVEESTVVLVEKKVEDLAIIVEEEASANDNIA